MTNAKCEDKLETNAHKLRNTRIVVINIPEEITTGNLEDTLLAHNRDVSLKQINIATKFCYETRKNTRNLVIEVRVQTRKTLLDRRVKRGYQICKIEDLVAATRCYNARGTITEHAIVRGGNMHPLCRRPQAQGMYNKLSGIQMH
jgi:uncharacterized protein (DUF433 family)